MQGDTIVEMRHITKRFSGITAVDDVSITIRKGEIYALLGENGAGKSTLMSLLFGMYEPDEGEIYIRGKQERITSPNYAAKLNIGMVHQHFKLVQNYTIAENIVLGMEPMKKALGLVPVLDLEEAIRQIREISEKYGLEVSPTQKIQDTTVSIQQRTEILKMLYRDAEILIFDEPTAVLTPQETEYLLQIIRTLRERGKTIILITHKLDEIKKTADRCAVLCRGKLIAVQGVAQSDSKLLAELMVGRPVALSVKKEAPCFEEKVLEVENLSVRNREGVDVVKNVSFSIRGGEVFAIAGVAGNGQVEIASAVAGVTKAHSGVVRLCGKDITAYSVRMRMQEGISYIPEDRQNDGLAMDFSIGENMAMKTYFQPRFCRRGLLEYEEMDHQAAHFIQQYDIRCGEGAKTKVRTMSGGNQQKVIIAREIELDSELMIFVQPTRGLDIGAIENVHRKIMELRASGKAILLVSLELPEVMTCADTIGVIYNGQLLTVAPAQDLTVKQVGAFMMGVTNK